MRNTTKNTITTSLPRINVGIANHIEKFRGSKKSNAQIIQTWHSYNLKLKIQIYFITNFLKSLSHENNKIKQQPNYAKCYINTRNHPFKL